jgi:hypothetical protein
MKLKRELNKSEKNMKTDKIKTSLELKKLRQRFVSDYDLPIQVLHSPYFEERLKLFEGKFGAKTKYDNLLKLIDEKYEGKPQNFLEAYAKIREDIISITKNSQAFIEFKDSDFKKYAVKLPVGNTKLYTEPNAEEGDNFYVTFDLKKANYQAIKWAAPAAMRYSKTYEEFIGHFTDLDYFKNSKYIRQVVFGQLYPKGTFIVEKYLISLLYNFLNENFKMWGTPFSINTDEIIYKLDDKTFSEFDWGNMKHLTEVIKVDLGLDVRVNKFKLHLHQFKLATSEAKIDIFEKENFSPYNKDSLACVPSIYAPQIYKLLKMEEPTENDRTFYYEHELVTFKYPLILNKEQEEKVDKQKIDVLPF